MKKYQTNATSFTDRPLLNLFCTSLLLTATAANATVISSESDAHALGINLELPILSLSLDVEAPASVEGIAPTPFNNTLTVLGDAVPLGAQVSLPGLDVGLASANDAAILSATATTDVDGVTGVRETKATSKATGLTLDILNTLLNPGLGLLEVPATALSISTRELFSESTVSGDYANLTSMGNSYVADLAITLFGTPLIVLDHTDFVGLNADIDGVIEAAPNFQVVNLNGIVGLNLILNEQVGSCSNTICDLTVNALRLNFDAVDVAQFNLPTAGLVTGPLTGDVILGRSYSQMSAVSNSVAVPTPATFGLYGLALLGVAFTNRKRFSRQVK